LNGNIFNPECDGLEGVLDAYKSALDNVTLHGPTNFSDVINMANDMIEGAEVSQQN